MSANHFSYFRVKNFKRFKDLEVKDIGQFNLVLGDNNVGKTSFLEALMFEENFDVFVDRLTNVLSNHVKGNGFSGGVWEPFINKDEIVSSDEYALVSFQTNESVNEKSFPFAFDKATKEIFLRNNTAFFDEFLNKEKFENKNWQIKNPSSSSLPHDFFIPLISNLKGNHDNLTVLYSRLINQGARHFKADFVKSLSTIESSLLSIDYDTVSVPEKVLISIESSKSEGRILLGMQGEGFISLFQTILFLMNFQNKRLMIDEIDAGIHHERMKDYWKVILQSAKDNDVQIFATTHNQECIQYFQGALDELGQEYQQKARSIRLVEHAQTKQVLSFTSSFDKIREELITGNEIR